MSLRNERWICQRWDFIYHCRSERQWQQWQRSCMDCTLLLTNVMFIYLTFLRNHCRKSLRRREEYDCHAEGIQAIHPEPSWSLPPPGSSFWAQTPLLSSLQIWLERLRVCQEELSQSSCYWYHCTHRWSTLYALLLVRTHTHTWLALASQCVLHLFWAHVH